MATGSSSDPAFTTTGTPYVTGISFDAGTNTLANYVQAGTWTPTIAFGGASTGVTYVDQIGEYTRIGNIVFFNFIVTLSSKGSSTGVATMGGFPVAANLSGAQNMSIIAVSNITYDGTNVAAYLDTSGTPGTVFSFKQTGPGGISTLSDTNFANNTRLETNGFYFTS
jgi:hypothetical protein